MTRTPPFRTPLILKSRRVRVSRAGTHRRRCPTSASLNGAPGLTTLQVALATLTMSARGMRRRGSSASCAVCIQARTRSCAQFSFSRRRATRSQVRQKSSASMRGQSGRVPRRCCSCVYMGSSPKVRLLMLDCVLQLVLIFSHCCPSEPCQGIRSFDRSFVLAPAPAGSRHAHTHISIFSLPDVSLTELL